MDIVDKGDDDRLLKRIEVHNGWIVYRVGGTRKQHTHFYNKKAAGAFLKLMKKGILPNNHYFLESARRVLTEKEFKQLRKERKKQKFINKR